MNIFITSRLIKNITEEYDSIDRVWFEIFKNHNIFKSINHFDFMETNINNLKLSDLIIFTGGGDINILNENNEDKIREQIEDKLIELSLEQNKTIITICRGTQHMLFKMKKVEKFYKFKDNVNLVSNLYSKSKDFKNLSDIIFHNKYGLTTDKDLVDFEFIHTYKGNRVATLASKSNKIFSTFWHPERNNKYSFFEEAIQYLNK